MNLSSTKDHGRLWLVVSPENDTLEEGTVLKEQPALEREVSRVWQYACGGSDGMYPGTETVWNTIQVDASYLDGIISGFKLLISSLVSFLLNILSIGQSRKIDVSITAITFEDADRLFAVISSGDMYLSTNHGGDFEPYDEFAPFTAVVGSSKE